MPRDDAITSGDLVAKLDMLHVACDKCGRNGAERRCLGRIRGCKTRRAGRPSAARRLGRWRRRPLEPEDRRAHLSAMSFERALAVGLVGAIAIGNVGAGYGLKLFKPMPVSSVMPLIAGSSVSTVTWNTVTDKPITLPMPPRPGVVSA